MNVVSDAETEAKKPEPPRKERVEKEKAPIIMREPSARANKGQNRHLEYPNENQQPTQKRKRKPPPGEAATLTEILSLKIPKNIWNEGIARNKTTGEGFVLVGAVKHYL